MHRSNIEDSGGWKRYWYEQTGVPQSAQTRRSPSETVSQLPTFRQCCRLAGALQVVMPSILAHRDPTSTASEQDSNQLTTDRNRLLVAFTESVPEPFSPVADTPSAPSRQERESAACGGVTCQCWIRSRGMKPFMKSLVPVGAVVAAALVLGTAPAAQADNDVNSNVVHSNFLQKIANHPTVHRRHREKNGTDPTPPRGARYSAAMSRSPRIHAHMIAGRPGSRCTYPVRALGRYTPSSERVDPAPAGMVRPMVSKSH